MKINDTNNTNEKQNHNYLEDETKLKRMSPTEYDDRYIKAYLDNPEAGKVAALRESGHPNPTRARAWQLHDRLSQEIDQQLDKLISQDGALGRAVLVALTKGSTSDSVKAQCATKLMEYAGKSKADRIIVEHRTTDEIDSEIELIQRRILEAQGEPGGELH